MKKILSSAIQFLTKPFIAVGNFAADHNLHKAGALWGLGVIATVVLPSLAGAFEVSTATAYIIAGVGAGPFLLSSASIILGAGAEKLYDFAEDLRHEVITEELYKDNETVAQIRKELKDGNEKYNKYEGMNKKQIKSQIQFERHCRQAECSVDEVGY